MNKTYSAIESQDSRPPETCLELAFSSEDIQNIISFGRMLKNQSQIRAVASIATFLMSLPSPFLNKKEVDLDLIA